MSKLELLKDYGRDELKNDSNIKLVHYSLVKMSTILVNLGTYGFFLI